MNKLLYCLIIAFFLLLISCTKTQFGVPEKEWQQMNEEQKTLVIESYNKRLELIEQRRLERAKKQRLEQAIKEQQRLKRLKRVERTKQGLGVLGDYIRISILSCKAKMGSKYRSINPISIKLADGEEKIIKIKSSEHKYTSYTRDLSFIYNEGLVTIGATYSGQDGLLLPYKQAWLKGARYHNLSAKRPVRLKECEVEISVIPTRNRHQFY